MGFLPRGFESHRLHTFLVLAHSALPVDCTWFEQNRTSNGRYAAKIVSGRCRGKPGVPDWLPSPSLQDKPRTTITCTTHIDQSFVLSPHTQASFFVVQVWIVIQRRGPGTSLDASEHGHKDLQ